MMPELPGEQSFGEKLKAMTYEEQVDSFWEWACTQNPDITREAAKEIFDHFENQKKLREAN